MLECSYRLGSVAAVSGASRPNITAHKSNLQLTRKLLSGLFFGPPWIPLRSLTFQLSTIDLSSCLVSFFYFLPSSTPQRIATNCPSMSLVIKTTDKENVQVTERCSLQCLPAELLVKVMKGMDSPHLGKLIEAWPAAAGVVRAFENQNLFRSSQLSMLAPDHEADLSRLAAR